MDMASMTVGLLAVNKRIALHFVCSEIYLDFSPLSAFRKHIRSLRFYFTTSPASKDACGIIHSHSKRGVFEADMDMARALGRSLTVESTQDMANLF